MAGQDAEREALKRRADGETARVAALRAALIRIAATRGDPDVFGACQDAQTLAEKALEALDEADAATARAMWELKVPT